MKTLLEILYHTLTAITEDFCNNIPMQMPMSLRQKINSLTDELGKWMDDFYGKD